jgi:hypothetical protein
MIRETLEVDAMKYELRFDYREIETWARRYILAQKAKERETEDRIEDTIGPNTRTKGFYSKGDFLELANWKSPRPKRHYERNDDDFLHEVTSVALTTSNERLRIEILTLLSGVDWRTASVLLHFGHFEPYPILDVRALWSLSISKPSTYNFSFWYGYVQVCRNISGHVGVSMRILDRALWQFSKENQPPDGT